MRAALFTLLASLAFAAPAHATGNASCAVDDTNLIFNAEANVPYDMGRPFEGLRSDLDLKVKVLLSTVVPFAFASFYPTTLALGRSEFLPYFWAVPAVALLLALLNVALWRKGIAKYGSTGS